MSKYIKVALSNPSKEAILIDIQSLTWNEEQVYPAYPDDYEKSFGPLCRFVVTEPRQMVKAPAVYDDNGNEVHGPIMGDWVSHLVLPKAYDTSHLKTKI